MGLFFCPLVGGAALVAPNMSDIPGFLLSLYQKQKDMEEQIRQLFAKHYKKGILYDADSDIDDMIVLVVDKAQPEQVAKTILDAFSGVKWVCIKKRNEKRNLRGMKYIYSRATLEYLGYKLNK